METEQQPLAWVNPMSVVNLRAGGVSSKEWVWAKPEAGDVPVYLHPPHAMPIEWRNALEEAIGFANRPAEGHDEGMLLLALNERVEKLLAIPVESLEPTGLPKLPSPVVQHSQLGPLFDRLQMQFYAAKAQQLEVERIKAPRDAGYSSGPISDGGMDPRNS